MCLIYYAGTGPSSESMDMGYLQISAVCTGDQGGRTVARIFFPTGKKCESEQVCGLVMVYNWNLVLRIRR